MRNVFLFSMGILLPIVFVSSAFSQQLVNCTATVPSETTAGESVKFKAAATTANKIASNLEQPANGSTFSGIFRVSGWAVASTGVSFIDVLVDGAVKGRAQYGLARPDICNAYSTYPNCGTSGFQYSLDPASLTGGKHSLQIRVTAIGGLTAVNPATPITFTIVRRPPCTPQLISPSEGAVIDNGRYDHLDRIIWSFEWTSCPGATAYHLYAIHEAAQYPTINAEELSWHKYIVDFQDRSPMVDYRHIWTWKVRAKVDGQWGAWSSTRTFSVEPVDTDPPTP